MFLFLLFLFFVAVFLIYRHRTWRALPWPEGSVKLPSYQAHRGYWVQGEQENTLKSFIAAAKQGFQMIEFDVCLSKDRVPVIFHDVDLKRLGQRNLQVADCTAAELKKFVSAPTLEEVLVSKEVPPFLNIELKSALSLLSLRGVLEKQVALLIKKHQAEQRVVFSSFNPISLWHLSRLLPKVPRALLATQEVEHGNYFYLRERWLAPYVGVHALHLDYHSVSEASLRVWKQRGVPVALWTVNDSEVAARLLSAGAVSIITDSIVPK